MARQGFIITLLILALSFSVGMAENLVEITFDPIYVGGQSTDVIIRCENDVPLNFVSMGFTISVSGDLAAEIADAQIRTDLRPGGIPNWYLGFDASLPHDSVCFVTQNFGSSLIAPGPSQPWFVININYSNPCSWDGELCLDTCTFPPEFDAWLWTEATSGDTITPPFNDGLGPICREQILLPCGIIYYTIVPENDELIGRYCEGVSFQFESMTGFEPYSQVLGYSFCSPIPEGTSVTSDGLFTLPPHEEGEYEITLKAYGDCPNFGIYTFNVILEGHDLCGDANCDDFINISDAVSIINYIFVGGAAPSPLKAGDVNCDSVCNVSDAVWIINYVFIGGNAPCDTNGDEIPDC